MLKLQPENPSSAPKPRLAIRLLLATLFNVGYAIAFWYVVMVMIGWEIFKIGMGLGGAVYPALFIPPLLALLIIYYVGCYAWFSRHAPTRGRFCLFALGIPAVLTSILLVAFCPMDSSASFATELFARLFR